MAKVTTQQLSELILGCSSRRTANTCTAVGQVVDVASAACTGLLKGGVEEHFLFLKPELLSIKQKDQLRRALEIVFSSLMEIGEVDQAVLLAADSVEARGMVQGQYRILRSLATEPTPWAVQAVHECMDSDPPTQVYTASAALEMFWEDDAVRLSEDWDKGTGMKVGPGLYTCRLTKGAHTFAVLNGFYPAQESWLCQSGGQLLCFRLKTSLPLCQVREEVVGSVAPEFARPGSIRHQLYLAREQLGFSNIAISRNALHIAPNALDSLLGVDFLNRFNKTSGTNELFRQYVELHQPSLLPVLHHYIAPNEIVSPAQLFLHTQCEDLTYRGCLDVMRECQLGLCASG
ncbi:hypothetical protein D3C85_319480 [compost metagenome]